MTFMEQIKSVAKGKCAERFTGAVKFGIERHRVVSIAQTNRTEVTTSFARGGKVFDELERIFAGSGNGSVVLVFEGGEIAEFGYVKTLKGDDLKGVVEG